MLCISCLFLLLSYITLYGIQQFVDLFNSWWIVRLFSSLGLLHITMLWTFLYKFFSCKLSFLLGNVSDWNGRIIWYHMFKFLQNCKLFSKVVVLFYIATEEYEFSSPSTSSTMPVIVFFLIIDSLVDVKR